MGARITDPCLQRRKFNAQALGNTLTRQAADKPPQPYALPCKHFPFQSSFTTIRGLKGPELKLDTAGWFEQPAGRKRLVLRGVVGGVSGDGSREDRECYR